MAKTTIRRPDGTEIIVEDAEPEFVAAVLGAEERNDPAARTENPDADTSRPGRLTRDLLEGDLRRRLASAMPTTNQEYVTVLAAAAEDYGLQGIDRGLAQAFTHLLGDRAPRSWRGTFANAHAARLLKQNGERWLPSQKGRRFAERQVPQEERRRLAMGATRPTSRTREPSS